MTKRLDLKHQQIVQKLLEDTKNRKVTWMVSNRVFEARTEWKGVKIATSTEGVIPCLVMGWPDGLVYTLKGTYGLHELNNLARSLAYREVEEALDAVLQS